jgi:integrase
MARQRGTGSIYRPKGSNILHLKFYRNGRAIRESTHQTKMKQAEKLLQLRLASVSTGTFIPLQTTRIMVAELADDLIREYRINKRKSTSDLEARWKKHLKPFFGDKRAVEITSSSVDKYIDARADAGAADATINRELSALKRMFSLGRKSTPPKVRELPYIRMLRENNQRTGFLRSKEHDALAAATARVGLWLRAIFELGHTYGWRSGELKGLRVRQVNLSEGPTGTIRLEPGTTKNGQGREVPMTLRVRELLKLCVHGKGLDDFVFTRESRKAGQPGKPVLDFRKTWAKACKEAKVPTLHVHDLRRTAARNLRNSGAAEEVIMDIGGWKTASVFKRYSIVDQSDKRSAMTSLEACQQRADAEAAAQEEQTAGQAVFSGDGHSSGIVAPKPVQRVQLDSASVASSAPIN